MRLDEVGSTARRGWGIAAVAAAAVLMAGSAAAQSFQNGSFENGSYGGGTIGTFADGSTAITGWTIRQGSANNVQWQKNGNGDGLVSSDLLYSLDLTGSDDAGYGGVEQSFATIAGHSYSLSYDVGTSSTYTAAGGATVYAQINGVTLFSTTNPNTAASSSWLTGTGSFLAAGASTTLDLYGSAGGHFTGLDNVKVVDLGVLTSAVPEPASWALMIGGAGLVGGAMRRRRSSMMRMAQA